MFVFHPGVGALPRFGVCLRNDERVFAERARAADRCCAPHPPLCLPCLSLSMDRGSRQKLHSV